MWGAGARASRRKGLSPGPQPQAVLLSLLDTRSRRSLQVGGGQGENRPDQPTTSPQTGLKGHWAGRVCPLGRLSGMKSTSGETS